MSDRREMKGGESQFAEFVESTSFPLEKVWSPKCVRLLWNWIYLEKWESLVGLPEMTKLFWNGLFFLSLLGIPSTSFKNFFFSSGSLYLHYLHQIQRKKLKCFELNHGKGTLFIKSGGEEKKNDVFYLMHLLVLLAARFVSCCVLASFDLGRNESFNFIGTNNFETSFLGISKPEVQVC